ncbi:MAG: N-acetylmuramoyl-L-alanine amidase [Dysgonomonas sp.]|nr:N-acetylmuramoyl-L-alanine amidase [Dysgonomonas sp.]
MKKILSFFFCLFLFCSVVMAAESKFVVVIDAGHGGKDGGAVRGIYKEKEINLGVALALGKMIEENFKDVKVVYTRRSDVFVDLNKRTQIANKAKANLFISIHTNSTASKSTSASGADTYILGLARSEENLAVAKRENSVILMEDDYTTKYQGFDPNSTESYIIFEFMTNTYMEQSLKFANFIQKDVRNIAKRTDRGVRQAGFLVLRQSSMPSVLVELGFINNPTEAKFLSSRLGQRTMATAIYSGFIKFKQDFDKKQGNFVVSKSNKKDEPLPNNEVIEENITVETKITEEKVTVPSTTKTKTEPAKAVVEKTVTTTIKKTSENNQIEYRIQFLVSPNKLANNSSQFKGLSPVDSYKDGKVYKYTYGSTTNFNEAVNLQKRVRTKFKDAFVVKFKNGERIK